MDAEYLRDAVGTALAEGLAEVSCVRPADPIQYLAQWLLKRETNLLNRKLDPQSIPPLVSTPMTISDSKTSYQSKQSSIKSFSADLQPVMTPPTMVITPPPPEDSPSGGERKESDDENQHNEAEIQQMDEEEKNVDEEVVEVRIGEDGGVKVGMKEMQEGKAEVDEGDNEVVVREDEGDDDAVSARDEEEGGKVESEVEEGEHVQDELEEEDSDGIKDNSEQETT